MKNYKRIKIIDMFYELKKIYPELKNTKLHFLSKRNETRLGYYTTATDTINIISTKTKIIEDALTLVHEIAHVLVWKRYQQNLYTTTITTHGKEFIFCLNELSSPVFESLDIMLTRNLISNVVCSRGKVACEICMWNRFLERYHFKCLNHSLNFYRSKKSENKKKH